LVFNIFSTQDQAAAAMALQDSLRLERLNEVDFDWCIEQTLFFGDRKPLNMILDDGGDLTNMVMTVTQIVAGIKVI
jgi:adenosylhomocysteinase